jgi:uncharacterized peroxidase-related enzyme
MQMPRISPVDPATATGDVKEMLAAVQASFGVTPNLMRTLATAPAALKGYLDLAGALGGGVLGRKFRAQIALTVAQANACGYCLSAHTVLGTLAGLTADQMTGSRAGRSRDAKENAGLTFANAVVAQRGQVDDAAFARVRAAGFSDAEITEIVANVVLNIYTNYINHVAQTTVDFPPVDALRGVGV